MSRRHILERDNYTCQKCGIKDRTITFQSQSYYPRYAKALPDGRYVYYTSSIKLKNEFLAATPENIKKIKCYKNTGSEARVESHAYYYKKLSEETNTDGYKLREKLRIYLEKNPHSLNTKKITTMNCRTIIDVHHVDGNKKNNDESNLVSVCRFCHQDIHQRIFP